MIETTLETKEFKLKETTAGVERICISKPGTKNLEESLKYILEKYQIENCNCLSGYHFGSQ